MPPCAPRGVTTPNHAAPRWPNASRPPRGTTSRSAPERSRLRLLAPAVLVLVGCGEQAETSPSASGAQLTRSADVARKLNRQIWVAADVVSPDHNLAVAVVRLGACGFLVAGPTDGAKRRVYSSDDACCASLVWATSTLLVFDDDGNVTTIDLSTPCSYLGTDSCYATTPLRTSPASPTSSSRRTGSGSPATPTRAATRRRRSESSRYGPRVPRRPSTADTSDSAPEFASNGTLRFTCQRSTGTQPRSRRRAAP